MRLLVNTLTPLINAIQPLLNPASSLLASNDHEKEYKNGYHHTYDLYLADAN